MLNTSLKAAKAIYLAIRLASQVGRPRLAANFALILVNGIV
jgi:hypothetical protein